MKRSNQLPSAQAVILNASPSLRQADRLAAPLRRRGAWTQFVEARLREPVFPEQDLAEPPSSPIDDQPAGPADAPSLPSGEPTNEVHPLLVPEDSPQPIAWPQDDVSRRLNEAAESIGRKSNVDRPGAGPDTGSVDPAFQPGDVRATECGNHTQPAPSDWHTGPEPATAAYASGTDEGEGLSPAADQRSDLSTPDSRPPESTPPAAPPQLQPPMHTSAAGVGFVVQDPRTTLIERRIADDLQDTPSDRHSVTNAWKVRNPVGLLAPITILLAVGAGLLLCGNLVSLFNARSHVVITNGEAAPVQSPPQIRRKLKPAAPTFVHRASIEAAPTAPPTRTLPTTYGIFASSGGRMIRLEPMNIRLPDSRIAVGLITKPPTVVVPHGPLSFVAYQRELMTSAPDNAQLRIVAEVARAPSSPASGKLAANNTWAIRSVSVDLTVAPVPENREMVELQPENPDLVLSPGRYLLVFKNQAYGFVVAGAVTDKAHCLERAETEDGEKFSECRKLP